MKYAPLLLLASSLTADAQAQTSFARYEARWESTWSSSTHPGAYPNNAHYSPPVGGMHSAAVDFWQPGQLASPGVELMAETGNPSVMQNEVGAAINAGTAGLALNAGGFDSPGLRVHTFVASSDFPLATIVTMVAPSPDWFIGADSVVLHDGERWLDVTVPLVVWDAGTDSGAGFTSPNQSTNPAQPISLVTGGPFTGSDPLGTLTFTRVELGANYCGPAAANSTGQSGALLALGSGQAGAPLTLAASQLPQNEFGYFLVSNMQGSTLPPSSPSPICLGGNIGRFVAPGQIGNTGLAGALDLVVDTNALPVNPTTAVQAGQTWNFQAWYRDGSGGSNLTDAVAVPFN